MTDLTHLIEYRCVRADHLRMGARERVFVHRSAWAYCAGGRNVANHDLIPTGGLERRQIDATVRRGRI